MYKDAVFMYKGTLLGLSNEENPVIHDYMNELWSHYSKENKAVTEGQMLHIIPLTRNASNRNWEWWFPGLWGGGNKELTLNSHKVPVMHNN